MKQKFRDLYKLVKPIYASSRPFDLDHINWLFSVCEEVAQKSKLDEDIFIPLILLHDIGYSKLNDSFWEQDTRKAHMRIGAEMAKEILTKLNYPSKDVELISGYIAIHDTWALGDDEIYRKDKLLSAFSDLDFGWIASQVGFPHFMKELNLDARGLLTWLLNNEKLVNRPFANAATKDLFYGMIRERMQEYGVTESELGSVLRER